MFAMARPICLAAIGLWLLNPGTSKASGCEIMERLRQSADRQFEDIKAKKLNKHGKFSTTYVLSDGTCHLQFPRFTKRSSYTCSWRVGEDEDAAAKAFDDMVESTKSCTETEDIVRSDRGSHMYARMPDGENRAVDIKLEFLGRIWEIVFRYTLRKR